MSAELVPYVGGSVAPSFTAEWLLDPAEIAQRIGGTDFVPRGLRDNPAAITAALLYGQEIGLGRMASLATISVIDGRPSLAAEAQRALIYAAGHELGFEESTATRCIAWGRRRGSRDVTRITWTIDDAQRAGLAGRNAWRTYPRQMLMARASAELARAVFPDVIRGLRAVEELEDGPAPGAEPGPPAPEPTTTRRRRRKADPAPPTAPETETTPGAVEPGAAPSGPPQRAAATGLDEAPVAGAEQPSAVEGAGGASATAEREAPAPGNVPGNAGNVEDGPLVASDQQLRMIWALMREVGLEGEDAREQRLAYCSRVIQHPLESSAHLTMSEATSVIHDLQAIADLPTPEERLLRVLPPNEAEVVGEVLELGGQVVDDPGA